MVYFVDEQLDEDEQLSIDAAVAGYDEECRSWRALEDELDTLRRDGIFV